MSDKLLPSTINEKSQTPQGSGKRPVKQLWAKLPVPRPALPCPYHLPEWTHISAADLPALEKRGWPRHPCMTITCLSKSYHPWPGKVAQSETGVPFFSRLALVALFIIFLNKPRIFHSKLQINRRIWLYSWRVDSGVTVNIFIHVRAWTKVWGSTPCCPKIFF